MCSLMRNIRQMLQAIGHSNHIRWPLKQLTANTITITTINYTNYTNYHNNYHNCYSNSNNNNNCKSVGIGNGYRFYGTRTVVDVNELQPLSNIQTLNDHSTKLTKLAITSVKPKLLVDSFDRAHTYLRISLTERCNLRCTYCMPEEGVTLQPKSHLLTQDEIFYLARLFVEQGVRKIRLTGGEPTIHRDIIEIIGNLKKIPKLQNVSITTNGLLLTRLLVPMQRAGLDGLNISLDTLKAARFEKITRRRGWERVIAGIDLAIQLGYIPKINCVLMRNFNDDEICDFIEFTKDRLVDVRFIEYMPFSGNKWHTDKLVSYKDTLKIIKDKWPQIISLPNEPNDTSKAYKVPEYKGQVGFITSMTEHFCSTCNRLRLTADGNLKVCLFGNKEVSLRDALRSNATEEQLLELIAAAVKGKKKHHAGIFTSSNAFNSIAFDKRFCRNVEFIADGESSHDSNWWLKPISSRSQYNRSAIEKAEAQSNHHYCYTHHTTPMTFNRYCKQAVTLSVGNRLANIMRCYSINRQGPTTELTHVNSSGKANMVDVGHKPITHRQAEATATVYVGADVAQLIHSNNLQKGDVLSIAELAGILAAKKTSDLIPLCHNINISSVKVEARLDLTAEIVILKSLVRCHGQTGVEMEALTAVTIAALTVYDMCKAVSHKISIGDVRLIAKSGGQKRDFHNVS